MNEKAESTDSSLTGELSVTSSSVLATLRRFESIYGSDAAQFVINRAIANSHSGSASAEQLDVSIKSFIADSAASTLVEHEELGCFEITSEPFPIPEA